MCKDEADQILDEVSGDGIESREWESIYQDDDDDFMDVFEYMERVY